MHFRRWVFIHKYTRPWHTGTFPYTRPVRTPSTTSLVNLASFFLKRNYFFFNNTPYYTLQCAPKWHLIFSVFCLSPGRTNAVWTTYSLFKLLFLGSVDVFLLWKGPIPEVQILVPARFLTVNCTKTIKKKKRFSRDRYHLMQCPCKPTYSCWALQWTLAV